MSEPKDKSFSIGKVIFAVIGLGLVLAIPGLGSLISWIIGLVFSIFVGGYAFDYLIKFWGGSVLGFMVPDWVCYVLGFFFASLSIPVAILVFLIFDKRTAKEVVN